MGTIDEALRKRIEDLCFERNITRHKLATLSGINHSTLDNIFRGRSRNTGYITIDKIAQGFGITLSEFFDFPEIKEAEEDD